MRAAVVGHCDGGVGGGVEGGRGGAADEAEGGEWGCRAYGGSRHS